MNLLTSLYIYSYIDMAEIFLISFMLYYSTRWFLTHKHYHLLISVYTYLGIYTASCLFRLNALLQLLQIGLPAFASIIILSYQKTLFKLKGPATKTIKPANLELVSNWSDILIRLLYLEEQENVILTCIIEGQQDASFLFSQGLELNTHLSDKLFYLLHESKYLKNNTYMYLSNDGTIKKINAQLDLEIEEESNILQLCSLHDCLVLKIDKRSRLFNLHLKSHNYLGLNAEQVKQSIAHYIKTISLPIYMQEKNAKNHHQSLHQ
jgi:hypothetical protein